MRDPQVEQWLSAEKAQWEYIESLPLDDIDVEASKRNQARPVALIPTLRDEYIEAMIDGAEFPAIIGYRPDPAAGVVLIGGNHRVDASIATERTSIDCYLVSGITEMDIRLLTWSANGLNGERGDQDTRLAQAMHFHRLYPRMTIKEVARRMRVSRSKLELRLRVEEVDLRLIEYNIDPSEIGGPNKTRLHQFQSDVVFKLAARFLQRSGIKGGLADEFWADLRRCKTEAQAEAMIQAWETRPEVAALLRDRLASRRPLPKSKIQIANSRLRYLVDFFGRYPDLVSLEVADRREVQELVDRGNQLVRKIRDIAHQVDGSGLAAD